MNNKDIFLFKVKDVVTSVGQMLYKFIPTFGKSPNIEIEILDSILDVNPNFRNFPDHSRPIFEIFRLFSRPSRQPDNSNRGNNQILIIF